MTHLQKFRNVSILKWVSSSFYPNYYRTARIVLCPTGFSQMGGNFRFYGKRKAEKADDCDEVPQVPTYVKEGQDAMLDYLHSTRSLQFMDAEHMSKNSPLFLERLLNGMDSKEDIGRTLTRFLRFHPINEFEPLFESMGLKPSEYSGYLPRQLMFLNDDPVFMNNYHVLCDYGFPRGTIGRLVLEATDVFRYDEGVLHSKLMSFAQVGLNQSMVIKLVTSLPSVLVGSANRDFFKLMRKLKELEVPYDRIEARILKEDSCKWSGILGVICLLSKMGYTEEQLQVLISQQPELFVAKSGQATLSLISFLTKFGVTSNEVCNTLLQIQKIPIAKFLDNLRSCYAFLVGVEMDVPSIGSIVFSHSLMLGSCPVKKYSSVINFLGAGKKRMCEMIKENPEILKNWVYGKKIERLSNEQEKSYDLKVKFLLDLGFVENSKEMEKAMRLFRGKGMELQERFDCFVDAGLDPQDVLKMVKTCPQILNQTKDVITTKIDYLVNDMGYPLSALLVFPAYISYTMQRAKLRLSMYNWLKGEGRVDGKLALSTLVACSDEIFMKTYVKSHPRGYHVWESLKKEIYSD